MALVPEKLPQFALAALVFALALVMFVVLNQSDSPSSGPASPDAAAPPAAVPTQARIDRLEREIEAGNRDPQAYAALGTALVQGLRETQDRVLYVRAKRAFAAAVRRDRSNVEAIVGLGTLALTRHDFRAALRLGRKARAAGPRSFAPFAVLVDAYVELGRYAAAERTLQQMVDFKPSLAAYARISYFRELHGDLPGALRAMRLAVAATPGPGENRSSVQTLIGGLEFQRGRLRAATSSYRSALAGQAGYVPALEGMARVEAARGRYGRAIEHLRGVVARRPLPEYLIPLIEIQLAAGRRTAAARDVDRLRVEQRRLAGTEANVGPEQVLFEADHGSPERALALSRRAYAAAPSVRAADALGWALTKSGRPRRGLSYARRSLRLGSRDPLLLYHAGVSAKAAGRPDLARRYLSRALKANPGFSPLHAPAARRALRSLK